MGRGWEIVGSGNVRDRQSLGHMGLFESVARVKTF